MRMSTQEKQWKAYRFPDEQLDRVDAVRGMAPRTAMIRHLVDLGLASFERNPEQPSVRTTSNFERLNGAEPQGSPSAPGTVAQGRRPTASHAKPGGAVPVARRVNGVSDKDLARGYVKNAAGVRIPLDADGRPVFP